jgi:hypothetical protein
MDPGDGWKLAIAMQLRDHLAVGLFEGPHDLLVVLESLGGVAGPVDEGPDRDLARLHTWSSPYSRTSTCVNVPSGKADLSCAATESDIALSTRSS